MAPGGPQSTRVRVSHNHQTWRGFPQRVGFRRRWGSAGAQGGGVRGGEELVRWAIAHAGVFTRGQALERGVTVKVFRGARGRGEILPFEGVWILANHPPTFTSRCWAALFQAGRGSRVTGTSALRLYGLATESPEVVISVPPDRNRRLPGVRILRDVTAEPKATQVGGVPCASRHRAVVDALRLNSLQAGRDILHEALRLGWTDPARLAMACTELSAHRGLVVLRAHADYAASGSRAESERELLLLLKRAGIKGFVFNRPIHNAKGRLIAIGDCVNVELQLVIEVDGQAWHTATDRFTRDRTRQNDLVDAEWEVIRLTWTHLVDTPKDTTARISRAIDRRRRTVNWTERSGVAPSGPQSTRLQREPNTGRE